MKTKKLKNHVKKAKAALCWPIKEVSRASGNFQVASDPMDKTHTLFLPSDKTSPDPYQILIYLHELGHATFCEKVHPIFAANFPVVGIDQKQAVEVAPAINAASDWFVGHWFMEFCPHEAVDDLKEEFQATEELLEKEPTPVPADFCVSALIIAQAIKYLKEPIECGGILKEAVEAFLTAPPERPSAESCEALTNRLLALFSPLRGRIVTEEGHAAWHFSSIDSEKK